MSRIFKLITATLGRSPSPKTVLDAQGLEVIDLSNGQEIRRHIPLSPVDRAALERIIGCEMAVGQ